MELVKGIDLYCKVLIFCEDRQTSHAAHVFSIRGRQKRGPGTPKTHDQNFSKYKDIFFRTSYEFLGRQYWKHYQEYSYKLKCSIDSAKDKKKIKTYGQKAISA